MSLFFPVVYWCADRLSRIGFPGIRSLGNGLGTMLWYVLPGRRRLAIANIGRHLGMTPEAARQLAKESFAHNGRSFLECVLIPHFYDDSSRLRVPRPDLLERLLDPSRPAVIISAHLGAWELLAAPLGKWNSDRISMAVVRKYRNLIIEQLTTRLRSAHGVQIIGHRDVAFSVVRALRKNGIVAFLADHNTRHNDAAFLPFLGEEAAVNKGPALLALCGKAQIWPVFMIREGDTFVLHLEEPLDTVTLEGANEEKILTATRFYTEAIERMIRLTPEQWFWMHNRWKTKS